jgi:glycosyltransferase involved in cell wall biosynthesis
MIEFPSPRPRIGIDLHVADGIFQGSRTHCLELFSRVIDVTPECDFVLLTSDPSKLISFSQSFALPNVNIIAMPSRRAVVRLLWQLPQAARRLRISLLHTQYIVPPVAFCATAVTVHDILFESFPEYFEKSFVLRSRLLVPYSIRRSTAIFTVSDFSHRQICEAYSVPPKNVHTISNGVDTTRFFPGRRGMEVVKAMGLEGGEYFLTVGRLEPRKNHATLLRAWAKIKAPRPRLVIVGQRHFNYRDSIDLIRTLEIQDDVLILEQVSDVELPAIYRNAKGFVYTSWAEGFGMPLLEAMASGIPVVTSATTALTEVGAGATLYVDPSDPAEISAAINSLNTDSELRQSLIERGFRRAKDFTWERSARTVRDVYLRLFGLANRETL